MNNLDIGNEHSPRKLQQHPVLSGPFAEPPLPDRLLRVSEVCQLLAYSRATVYRLVAEGLLPVVKVGGTIRFRYRAMLRWMEEHEAPAKPSNT